VLVLVPTVSVFKFAPMGEVVARMGELRYRAPWAIPKMREPLKRDAHRSLSRKAVALRCAVCLAWVTTVAHHDAALIAQVKPGGGIVLAMDGGQPEKSHDTRDMVRDVPSGRVFGAKTLLSSATGAIEQWIDEVRVGGLPMVGVIRDQPESIG
jgi:hypothetical protein